MASTVKQCPVHPVSAVAAVGGWSGVVAVNDVFVGGEGPSAVIFVAKCVLGLVSVHGLHSLGVPRFQFWLALGGRYTACSPRRR